MAVCQTSDAAGPPGELDRMAPNWAAIGSAGPQNEPQSLHDHVQSGAEYHIGLEQVFLELYTARHENLGAVAASAPPRTELLDMLCKQRRGVVTWIREHVVELESVQPTVGRKGNPMDRASSEGGARRGEPSGRMGLHARSQSSRAKWRPKHAFHPSVRAGAPSDLLCSVPVLCLPPEDRLTRPCGHGSLRLRAALCKLFGTPSCLAEGQRSPSQPSPLARPTLLRHTHPVTTDVRLAPPHLAPPRVEPK
ncbi:uncharacterized protein PAN0_008d3649 [Moesziomyces antarcticus]|uniref:Uncharacterized protein n=1 Tax=Pseudozyma antarctica TaxID=84753 RepID=A0A081CFI6_PSEA2|nr:uncharacterized protein PAN0_008d3649 [Moesziomyces antarcticus]GAK65432.1 hypothetical protein PAN0_008d3649 [Moesziomyces antarcticus]